MKAPKEKTSTGHKILTVIGIVLCVILIPVLIINLTLIAKSYINKDAVPTVGGYAPLIVLTDSMYPTIDAGDIIIVKSGAAEDVEKGDVIAYFDPASKSGQVIVTHRVMDISTNEDGTIIFKTKGDANNAEDKLWVKSEELVGEYQFRIPNMGHVAMFMQTTTGLIVCVVLPLLLLIGYDVLRRKMYDKSKAKDTDALMAELEALRAQQAAPAAPVEEAPAAVESTATTDTPAEE